MTVRHRQRGRVYAWEDRLIAPLDRGRLAFASADGMVRAIWSELGLRFPPAVEPLPARSRCLGDATRLRVRLAASFPSWCLLHELGHSLTSTHEGHSDGHGPRFMGVYVALLARYLRLDPAMLVASARGAGVAVAADAGPLFVDAAAFCASGRHFRIKPDARDLWSMGNRDSVALAFNRRT